MSNLNSDANLPYILRLAKDRLTTVENYVPVDASIQNTTYKSAPPPGNHGEETNCHPIKSSASIPPMPMKMGKHNATPNSVKYISSAMKDMNTKAEQLREAMKDLHGSVYSKLTDIYGKFNDLNRKIREIVITNNPKLKSSISGLEALSEEEVDDNNIIIDRLYSQETILRVLNSLCRLEVEKACFELAIECGELIEAINDVVKEIEKNVTDIESKRQSLVVTGLMYGLAVGGVCVAFLYAPALIGPLVASDELAFLSPLFLLTFCEAGQQAVDIGKAIKDASNNINQLRKLKETLLEMKSDSTKLKKELERSGKIIRSITEHIGKDGINKTQLQALIAELKELRDAFNELNNAINNGLACY